LPEALELTASGVRDANIAHVARRMAAGAAEGRSLSDLLWSESSISASLVPIVRWGEQTGSLPEALATAAEMLEGRIQMRSSLLSTIMPPLAFVAIGSLAIGLVFGLFLPLVSLIQNLT
jgi:type II secretory pathway component PulF